MKKETEYFTKEEIKQAISQWLDFGEEAFKNRAHSGYFSADGWAARCLRFHLKQLTGRNKL